MKKGALFLKVIVGLLLVAEFGFAQTSLSSAKTATPAASGKKNIAVINLKSASGVTSGEADVISDRIRGELFNTGKVNVMERDQMQEILKEQGFQQSGACSNEACMVEMGQLLGVEQLVTGSLGKVGSIFLVNLRVIDVKTAKIIKVVSVDIKGDIEDVVSQLGSIAGQIVSADQSGTTTVTGTKRDDGERKVVEEQKPEEKKDEAEAVRPDEKKEKNKNRGGIRLAFSMYPSNPEVIKHKIESYLGVQISDSTIPLVSDNFYNASVSYHPFFSPSLVFTIAAGPFIGIDLGPSWTRGSYTMTYEPSYLSDTTFTQTGEFNVFAFALGINFVKRWYPFKLNIGAKLDFNYLNYSWEKKGVYTYFGYDMPVTDTTGMEHSFNIAYGARVGGEILLNKHVGVNVDFLFLYSYYETLANTFDSYSAYNTTTTDEKYSITLPKIGFSAGFNYYF